MKQEIRGLTLNNRFFLTKDLLPFCRTEIAEKTSPIWQLDIFRFILDFFDDSEFVLQKTSGSTGTPKTIQLSKQAMLESAKMTTSFFKLEQSDVAVLCLPVKYIAGKMMIVRALLAGLNLVIIEPAGTPYFTGLGKIDFCAMVPMQAANLLEQNNWPNCKTLILGGAETNHRLAEKLCGVETRVYETYGMAETYSHIAIKRINGEIPETNFTALPGIHISEDKRSCLQIEAPYLGEKVVTNDCVDLLSKNKFRWIGRFDSIINSGGIKIQSETLENQIQKITQIPSAVIGMPDALLTEKVVLVLETDKTIDVAEMLAKLSIEIDKKRLPKSIYAVKAFPRNESFKIDRMKLKELIVSK